MPQMLIVILSAFAAKLFAKLLIGAGLAVLSYMWVNDLVSQAQQEMLGLYSNLPSDILGVLGILKVPQAISIIMSAMAVAAFIKTSKIAIGRA